MRPYLVRYRPPPLSVSVPSALPFSPSLSPSLSLSFALSARYSSSSVLLRFPRSATAFAPGRIDIRRGGCNDRRPIRSAAIKLYHRLEWRLYFGNLALGKRAYSCKTSPRPSRNIFRLSSRPLAIFAFQKNWNWMRTLTLITRMLRFARNVSARLMLARNSLRLIINSCCARREDKRSFLDSFARKFTRR